MDLNRLAALESRVDRMELERNGCQLAKVLAWTSPPYTKRRMTGEEAARVMPGGDLAGLAHDAAARVLGLSYTQVRDARLGKTHKRVKSPYNQGGNQ